MKKTGKSFRSIPAYEKNGSKKQIPRYGKQPIIFKILRLIFLIMLWSVCIIAIIIMVIKYTHMFGHKSSHKAHHHIAINPPNR